MVQAVVPAQVVIDIPPVITDVITVASNDVPASVDGQATGARSGIEIGVPSAGLGAACPNAQGIRSTMRYPAQARRDGLQGEVLARFVVGARGDIRDIDIVSSSHWAFNSAVLSAIKQFNCVAQGREVSVEVPFSFRLE